MATNVIINGNISVGDPTYENSSPNLNWSFVLTGSGIAGPTAQTITSGSWQPLTVSSSLTNGTYFVFIRNVSTGSVMLAGTSAGGGFTPVIPPGGYNVLTFTTSSRQGLYAQATVAASTSILHSTATEK